MRWTVVLLVACGGARQDWRIEPCVGEDPTACQVGTIEVDGVERTYLLAPPPDFTCDAGKPEWPLMFAWHGSGENGASFRADLLARGLPDAFDDMFWVYPDGLEREDTDGYTGWNQASDGDDVAFFDALLDHLMDWCGDHRQVMSFGHSRGGRFVHTLACFRADAHVGFGSVGAGKPDSWECDDQAPVWLAHGTDDHQVPYAQGKSVRDHWRKQNECDPFGLFHRFERNACTPYLGCDEPLVFCPYTDAEWEGHAIPPFAASELRSFYDAL
jgi:poly(3-hydroxybutyrate) depolymerase